MPVLYVVGTPIGNMEDISLRALRVLREVGLIAAEDTRRTRRLLNAYDIHTTLTSYHEHSRKAKLEQLLGHLATLLPRHPGVLKFVEAAKADPNPEIRKAMTERKQASMQSLMTWVARDIDSSLLKPDVDVSKALFVIVTTLQRILESASSSDRDTSGAELVDRVREYLAFFRQMLYR